MDEGAEHVTGTESDPLNASVFVMTGPANYLLGWRAIGGSLEITSSQLNFRPGKIDRATGSNDLNIARSTITSVILKTGSVPRLLRSMNPAHLKSSVQVKTANGSYEFLVREPERVLRALSY